MDTTALRAAYDDLLAAAASTVSPTPTPPPGEWNADQVLAHIVLLNSTTIAAACSVTAGAVATYDNRLAQDTWTIDHTISLAGGSDGLRTRIRVQADALSALLANLSEDELDTLLPTLLLSHDTLLLNDQVPLRGLIDGLATTELPGHTSQLNSLVSASRASTPAGAGERAG